MPGGAGFSKQGAVDASFALDIMTFLGPFFQTSAALNTTLLASLLSGGGEVVLNLTANGANALTTPTAALWYAAQAAAAGLSNINGSTMLLRLVNTGSGTVTLTAGTGVTITGPNTVASNTFRDYVVTFTSSGAVTMQSIGLGTAP